MNHPISSRGAVARIALITIPLLFACNLFGSAAQQVQDGTDTPEVGSTQVQNLEPTPTSGPEMMTLDSLEEGEIQIPVPPPTTLDDLLNGNVDDGEWEYGEGLVYLLRYVNGELDADDIPAFEPVAEPSPTGLVRQAADYLSDPNNDPEYVPEIERLLGVMTPTQSVLDRISQPSETSSRDGVSMISHRVQTDVPPECTNIVEEGFSAQVDTGQFCYVYREVSEQQNRLRAYYPKWWEEDPEQMTWVEAALAGLFDSSPIYSDLGRFDNVNVVFSVSQGASSATTLAYETYFPPDEACPVVVLPLVYSESLDAFKQTLAHESFHCFQDWNFSTSPYAVHKWWMEGSAEYFSNSVYPSINYEYRFFEDAILSPILSPVFDLSYDNFLLFQHLANELGEQGLVSLLDAVSSSGGIAGQSSTLASYPDFDGMFQEYGVLISGPGVPDTDGHVEVPSPVYGVRAGMISQEGEKDFTTDPFKVGRFTYVYEKERRFLEEPVASDMVRHSAVIARNRRDLSAWSALPPELRSACGEDTKYMIVVTSVDGLGEFKANITEIEEAECDSCLLGTWDVDGVSYANYYEALLASQGQAVELFVAGHFYFQFNEDEEFLTRRDGLEVSTSIINQPSLVTTIDGQGSGRYTSNGETITISAFSSVTNNVAIRIEGVEVPGGLGPSTVSYGLFDDRPRGAADSGTTAYSGAYTCDLQDLVIEFPSYGSVTFHRVDDIIPTPVPTPGG